MADFRGTDRIRRAADAARRCLRHVRSLSLKGITVVEKQTLPTVRRFVQHYRKPVAATALAFVMIAGVGFGGQHYVRANTTEYYQVYVNGVPVGDISSRNRIEQWLAAKSAALDLADTAVRQALDEGQVTYQPVSAYKAKVNDQATLTALAGNVRTHPVGVQLVVEGEVVGIVRDRHTAEAILKRVREQYAPASAAVTLTASVKKAAPRTLSFSASEAQPAIVYQPERLVTSVEFAEKVSFREVRLTVDGLSDPEQIYASLTDGDTPMLNVHSVEKVTELEPVEAKVEYKTSEDLRIGKTIVLRQGKDGRKQVTYRLVKENGDIAEEQIVSEQIIEPPVAAIILKGSKVVAGEGTGEFNWPVLGHRITSYMGKRWGRMHKGIDLVGGSSILAADNGLIEFAGYKSSGTGNTIIIDHRNGFKTIYGHLKSIKVREGQIVEKGETMGIMGSTGRSTGTHLHFEIYQDGKLKNPTSFL
jgi:murein DD-endopeptidase MepM/ murein hydrolase activator NlpD